MAMHQSLHFYEHIKQASDIDRLLDMPDYIPDALDGVSVFGASKLKDGFSLYASNIYDASQDFEDAMLRVSEYMYKHDISQPISAMAYRDHVPSDLWTVSRSGVVYERSINVRYEPKIPDPQDEDDYVPVFSFSDRHEDDAIYNTLYAEDRMRDVTGYGEPLIDSTGCVEVRTPFKAKCPQCYIDILTGRASVSSYVQMKALFADRDVPMMNVDICAQFVQDRQGKPVVDSIVLRSSHDDDVRRLPDNDGLLEEVVVGMKDLPTKALQSMVIFDPREPLGPGTPRIGSVNVKNGVQNYLHTGMVGGKTVEQFLSDVFLRGRRGRSPFGVSNRPDPNDQFSK